MKFMLEIELGNEAMQTGEDISSALIGVSKATYRVTSLPVSGNIRDINGNTVGKWQVVEDSVSDPIERMYSEAFEIETSEDKDDAGLTYTRT